ncbi:MAG: hypothetical protein WC812_03350 [Candidatus Pacearchaeota archaeon]|jgi:fructose/tagatose bisphosphate aldolase
MEFTFEYSKGKTKVYHGIGEKKEKISIKALGWDTSSDVSVAVKEMYETFNSRMITNSKEPCNKNRNLIAKLTLEINATLKK